MTIKRHAFKTTAGALLVSLFCSNAIAGSSGGPVGVVMAHEGDVVIFAAGTHINKPVCSTVNDEWALSLSSPAGRAMYALLLTAKAQGKNVSVQGRNACSAWGDREAPSHIWQD